MKIKKIIIEFIPLESMRWHGLGDYFETDENGVRRYFIADTGNEIYNMLITSHEINETTAMLAHGIPVKVIDDYCDKVYAAGGEPDSVNPDSPIHKEHMFADLIERQLTFFCGIEQKTYDEDIDKMYEPKKEYEILNIVNNTFNFRDFKDDLMEIETRCFSECIQEDWEDKLEGLETAAVTFLCIYNKKVVGEIICGVGEPVDLNDPDYQENKADWDHLNALYKYMKPENGIYVNLVAVLPEYEGKGIGQSLIKAAIESSKAKGFRAMYCHANEGQSAHLFKKFGGQVIATRNNWFATEHNYSVIRINLED